MRTPGSPSSRPWKPRKASRGTNPGVTYARSDEVEPTREVGPAGDVHRHRAHVGVGPAVGDEDERRAPEVVDLELRRHLEPLLEQDADHRRREGQVARAASFAVATAAVDPPDRLGIEPDSRREAEAPSVDLSERDRGRPAGLQRVERPHRRDHRIARQPERTRKDTRPAARQEPERDVTRGAVDRLVVRAVTREDDDGVSVLNSLAGELGRVPLLLRLPDDDLGAPRDRRRDVRHPAARHPGRVRVDDEDDLRHRRIVRGAGSDRSAE